MKPSPLTLAALAALGLSAALAPRAGHAGAVTDGSTGAVQTLSGRFTVPQTLGSVRGTNLFHSFTRFGIDSGEAALFTTQDAGLRHVIARVTGGQASVLQGPLELQAAKGSSPDFWLVNPGGVIVGAGASFNVPAGLHLGAATHIRFTDGSQWGSEGAPGSSLSVAAPEAFGFLDAKSGTLAVRNTALRPTYGGALTLAGGELQLEHAQLATQGAPLRLQAQGALAVGAGAEVSASGLGPGAPLQITAARLSASAGALLSAWNYGDTLGSGLQVSVQQALVLTEGASLASYAVGAGMAGPLSVDATTLALSGSGEFGPSSITSMGKPGAPGALTVRVTDTLTLAHGASIGSSSRSLATPGPVSVQARRIHIDGQGEATTISSLSSDDGPAAAVEVRADELLVLRDGGQVFGATLGVADAGSVHVASARIEMQGGTQTVTGLYANALGSGRGGALVVDASTLSLQDGARISTSTLNAGSAGQITVHAEQLLVEGRGHASGIDSYAYGSSGNAGSVELQVSGEMNLRSGALIAAGALGSGSSGRVQVRAGTVRIDGRNAGQSTTGIAGDALTSGVGAELDIQATRLEVLEGGSISTSTASTRDGRPMRVVADSVLVDGGGNTGTATGIFADTQGPGRAESLVLQAGELTVTNEGLISTSTIGAGRGGTLAISAAQLRLGRSGGLASVAAGRGDAGRIEIQVSGGVDIAEGGYIVANSGGAGAAGDIDIRSATFTAAGSDPANGQRSRVASRALPDSAGQAGRISIVADGALTLGEGALLSIANEARSVDASAGKPSAIRLQGADITLTQAQISAAATAAANAGAIELTSSGALRLSDSGLRTSAASGQGGPITIDAAGAVILRNSVVTTSVLATDGGNGGDIRIKAPALALASGFVQANTVAQAHGGTVTIDAEALVPEGNHVFVGGNRIAEVRPNAPGYNVIQAAAPDGVGGRLEVTRPVPNLSGSLAALRVQAVDFGLLRPDICEAGIDSSFTVLGRGALPAPAGALLRSR